MRIWGLENLREPCVSPFLVLYQKDLTLLKLKSTVISNVSPNGQLWSWGNGRCIALCLPDPDLFSGYTGRLHWLGRVLKLFPKSGHETPVQSSFSLQGDFQRPSLKGTNITRWKSLPEKESPRRPTKHVWLWHKQKLTLFHVKSYRFHIWIVTTALSRQLCLMQNFFWMTVGLSQIVGILTNFFQS